MSVRTSVRGNRDRFAFAAAVAAPPAVAAVLLPWRATLQPTDVALLLVVVVVAVAANGRREPGLLAAFGSAVWYEFFWTRPYERFTITSRADVETTVLLLVAGAAVSELAARGRRSRRTVRTDTAYLNSIHTAANQASTGLTVPELTQRVCGQLTELLALRTARFEQGSYLGHLPRLDERGELIWDSKPWNLREHGMPDQEFELRVRSNGRTWGRFILDPPPVPRPPRKPVASPSPSPTRSAPRSPGSSPHSGTDHRPPRPGGRAGRTPCWPGAVLAGRRAGRAPAGQPCWSDGNLGQAATLLGIRSKPTALALAFHSRATARSSFAIEATGPSTRPS